MISTILSFFVSVYNSLIRFLAHHKTYSAFLLVIISSIFLYGIFSTPKVVKETHLVTIGSINQSVKVSGQVQSSKDANLAFQSAGVISYVGVRPGDTVQRGKVLATLSGSDAQATLLQAEANLSNAEAVLGQLKQGARKEEIAIKEQTLDNAKGSLDQSYSALPDSIQNVDAVTADVIKNKFAPLFVFSNSRYLLSFSSCDQRLQSDIETKRTNIENILADFQKKSSVISNISSTQTIDTTFEAAYQSAIMTNDLVNAISNLLLSSCSISNSSLDSLRTALSVTKTSMTTLFSDITAKRSALISAKNAYSQASRDLELTKAGTDPYKIQAQNALVSSASAQVASARSGVQKTVITAPFTGVISSVDLSIGETVSTGKTVISMLAVDSFEIEAKVPEIDIIKIKIGATAPVTLDAYGKAVTFPATVTRINPTASTEGSVPVYKVIVTFNGNDDRIKQGMTANVDITTESKSKVLVIPSRFATILDSKKGTVVVSKNGKEEVRDITLGARGSDGLVEVTGGIFEGETILSPSIGDRQAQKQTN